MKTSILTIVNEKGGVGKTTTTINLAASYADLGYRVLVIDADFQGNTTLGFGLIKSETPEDDFGLYTAVKGRMTFDRVAVKTNFGVDVVAGGKPLRKLGEDLHGKARQWNCIEQVLATKKLNVYDIVIIDTHPGFNTFTGAALAVSHYYTVPLFADLFSASGIAGQLNSVEDIRVDQNRMLTFVGAIITRFEKKNATHKSFEKSLRRIPQFKVLRTVIPSSPYISRTQGEQVPLRKHSRARNSPVAKAYTALAGEILPHLKGKRIGRRTAAINTRVIEKEMSAWKANEEVELALEI